ncbi:hypothetical protein FOE78_18550 [Microlunatus elymi]|uniref:Uncharacterized protein n=1 Tax=Microlunatus elymi TaxID=2596828 RepID=A0A516Q2J1_9ACTN|nr:hypothetical protein [Microlunatus elymi]QDP97643.1 hypothetical protein FOE78_18550 [Microlunatus elymi]
MMISQCLPDHRCVSHDRCLRDDRDAEFLELLGPDCDDLDTDDEIDWVDAAPFRAHLRRLIRETGVGWRTLAALAEVPAATVQRLLLGHPGRPMRQLHPTIAKRLFYLSLDVVRDAAIVPIRPARSRALICWLLSQGWSLDELSQRAGLPGAGLAELADGRSTSCTQLTAATVRAVAQQLSDRATPMTPAAGMELAIAG